MALAIKFQGIVEREEVRDYAELARLGHVSRARLTQIMNLTLLAPDIQEQLLFFGSTSRRAFQSIVEKQMRLVANIPCWHYQRICLQQCAGTLGDEAAVSQTTCT